jgi:hypothetical protein
MNQRTLLLAISILAVGMTEGSAVAQTRHWDRGFGLPGTDWPGGIMALQSFDDGSGPALYAAGDFHVIGSAHAESVARWNGSEWSPVGSELSGEVDALITFDDGNGPALYAGGSFGSHDNPTIAGIARWNGVQWESVGGGIGPGSAPYMCFERVYAMAVFDDGSGPALYAAGQFDEAGGTAAWNIAKWDGAHWSALDTGVGVPNHCGTVYALSVFDDGMGAALYVAGWFDQAGGVQVPSIAKWDGSTWSTVGGGIEYGNFYSLTTFDDGNGPALYAGGTFYLPGTRQIDGLARWDGTSWTRVEANGLGLFYTLQVCDLGHGPRLFGSAEITGLNSSVHPFVPVEWNDGDWRHLQAGSFSAGALAVFDDGHGPALYSSADLFTGNGAIVPGVGVWKDGHWNPVTPNQPENGLDRYAIALLEFDDGTGPALYVAGALQRAGAQEVGKVAKWDGQRWASAGHLTDWHVTYARCLAAYDDGSGAKLYVGGTMASNHGVRLDNIARLDGDHWSPLGSGVNGDVLAMTTFDDGTGSKLYAAGDFKKAGGVPTQNVAAWDGASWSALGSGLDHNHHVAIVTALAVYDDGHGTALYATGEFTNAGGMPVNNVAKWNGSTWSPLGGGIPFVFNYESVYSLAVFDDGAGPALYAGGVFSTAGGMPVKNIAKWNGSSWSAVGGGISYWGVETLAVCDDGTGPALFAGGEFHRAGHVAANGLAKWNGTTWSAIDNSPSSVLAIASFDDGAASPSLYVAGAFYGIGAMASSGIARWGE